MNRRQKRADNQHQQIDFHVFPRCGLKACYGFATPEASPGSMTAA
jgi:hypothetical protein